LVDPDFVIPAERLPPGFAQSVEHPPNEPAEAKPAATIVLLRDGEDGMEVLLLKRHRSSGFVPGAYVFPGGRTDEVDALNHGATKNLPDVPAFFWIAAVREVFEETGVLLARDAVGNWVADTVMSPEVQQMRLALLDDRTTLRDMLVQNSWQLDFTDVVYFAHWITPIAEPRRYDTRFFAARVPAGREVQIDPREMTDAAWLAPVEALDRFAKGRLPMVFPTVRTLEQLAPYKTTANALDALHHRAVEPIMPRLVRTATGVGIVIDPK
jgi:8-oxo-dGTP pyrophosphatase MutT (NUDIX family)